jgi:predicted transposase YdaD
LAPVLRQVIERLEREASPEDRAKLLTATYVLTGLRVTPQAAGRLFRGVQGMRDSSTYQAILQEGRQEGRVETLQNMLLRLGRHRFGAPSEAVRAGILAVTDAKQLERLTERLLDVSSWQELLERP